MTKMRIYELAKDLNITNKQLISTMKKFKIEVKNHMSLLNKTDVAIIKNKYSTVSIKIKAKDIFKHTIRNRIKPRECDISNFQNELGNLHKNMSNLEIQKKTEFLVPYILERYEGFEKVEKGSDFRGIPCDFFGFKNNTPYIIIFKGFLDRFKAPDKKQKTRLQKNLKQIKNFGIVLLQVKVKKGEKNERESQYRIFYANEIEIFF